MEFQKSSKDNKFNYANHHDANNIKNFKVRINEERKMYAKPIIQTETRQLKKIITN